MVCHGIPSKKTILKEGDILNIDITTILDGYYADASRMYTVGKVAPEAQRLVEIAKECMLVGIEAVHPWGYVGDIGAAVNAHAKANGCSVVTELGGHGVGKDFHEDPYIAHVGMPGTGMLIVPGMVFTVEPMINAGRFKVTVDKRMAGQFAPRIIPCQLSGKNNLRYRDRCRGIVQLIAAVKGRYYAVQAMEYK